MVPSLRQPELAELHLAAALHREHRLAAGLAPGDRAAEVAGRGDDRGVAVADAGLAAERAADVGDHDLDVGLVEPGVLRHQVARQVRVLGGEVQDHPVALRLDEDRVALDRGDGDALVLHPQPDHDVGAVEAGRSRRGRAPPRRRCCRGRGTAAGRRRRARPPCRRPRAARRSRRRPARPRPPPGRGSRRRRGRPGRRRSGPRRRPARAGASALLTTAKAAPGRRRWTPRCRRPRRPATPRPRLVSTR